MAQNGESQDQMGYEALAQEALRGVVKAALKKAAAPEGLPGAHHLYISFRTRAPGVSIPADLAEKYPDEMTIVIQHQFWDLAPGETFFSVTLRFSNQPKKLSLPYAAVTRFYDPSVQFLLQFDAPVATEAEPAGVLSLRPRPAPKVVKAEDEPPKPPKDSKLAKAKPAKSAEPPAQADAAPAADAPKIVSLDQFRKK